MKFGRFQHQSRTFFGLVEGDRVDELDGSPFGTWKAAFEKSQIKTPRPISSLAGYSISRTNSAMPRLPC